MSKSNVKLRTTLVRADFPLKTNQKTASLTEHITDELKNSDLKDKKLCPTLIKYILEKIENEFINKKEDDDKITKEDIFFEIYSKIFSDLTPAEKSIIKETIQFLIKQNLVKKQPLSKIMLYYLKKSSFQWIKTFNVKCIN